MKRILTFVLTLSMLVSLVTGMPCKEAKAAGYESAVQLQTDGEWYGDYWVTQTETDNWHKIIVPFDGKLTIKLMCYLDRMTFEFYNEDISTKFTDESYFYGTETSPTTETYKYVLSAGTYYVHAANYYPEYEQYSGRYKIQASFKEFGTTNKGADSYDSPLQLPAGREMVGAMTETDGVDWYRLSVPKDGRYTVKLAAYLESISYEFYNADLSQRLTDESYYYGKEDSPVTKVYNYTLSAGTYYIKFEKGSYTGKYTVSWEALNAANCSHEYTSTYVEPTYLKKGYTLYECKICGATYKDNYVAKKKLTQGYISSYSYAKGKTIHLRWSTVGDASGYQIRWSRKKSMKSGVKTKKIKVQSKSECSITKLAKKKNYYVQLRPYKNIEGKVVYGDWSAKAQFKTR